MSNLQPNCLKFDFQEVDQHAGGKWLIHDTIMESNVPSSSWYPASWREDPSTLSSMVATHTR